MADQFESSILLTIKKMLGPDRDYDAFDTDVITHINSAMMSLQQIGVGPDSGMFITGIRETWDDFFMSDKMLEPAKSYIYIFVKMVFDPPTNSFVMDSLQRTMDMLEWRLKEQARFFDAEKGKYVRRIPEPVESETDGGSSGTVVSSGVLCGSCQAVHIERDGITPLNDVGQNVCMKGGCCE